MKYSEMLKMSLMVFKARKLRSFLTMLGIIIGIASVVMVFSAGEGLKHLVYAQIDAWGSDTLEVEVKVPSASSTSAENAGGIAMGIQITTLTEDDAEAVLNNPNITDVYSAVLGQSIISYGAEKNSVNLWGVNSSYINIDAGEVEEGRFFTDEEDKSLSKVIVLGSKLKDKLFGNSEAIGKNIKLGRDNYKVIGVMESRGAIMYIDMDEMAFVPLRTLQKLIMGVDHIAFLLAKLKDPDLGSITAEDITLLMRDRHEITDPDKDDFAVTVMAEAKEMMDTVLGGITLLLIAIAGISLVVGGVGIMNIMYVSVSERINEIGLRKAVGANKKNILLQFLTEATILTSVGGIAGVILGVALSYLVSVIAATQDFEWAFGVSLHSLLISVGVAMAVGIIFGLWPAKKASDLDPIEALRFNE